MTLGRCIAVLATVINVVLADIPLCESSEQQPTGGRTWLETKRPLTTGEVHGVAAQFCSLDDVTVQIWRRVGVTSSYTLITSWRIRPTELNDQVQHISLEPFVHTISPDDRLGLWSEASSISIKKVFDPGYVQLARSQEQSPLSQNTDYTFEDILHPGRFMVELCYADGCPSTERTEPPPERNECPDLKQTDGKVLLERKRQLPTGLIKAIKTGLCNSNPVRVQLWQPVEGDTTRYRLLWQKVISGTDSSSTVQMIVVLDQDEYVMIEDTYRLGLQPVNTADVLPIESSFSSSVADNLVTSVGAEDVTSCGVSEFQDLGFPETFQLEFCYNDGCTAVASETDGNLHNQCDENPISEAPETDSSSTTKEHDVAGASCLKSALSRRMSVLTLCWLVLGERTRPY